MQENANQSWKIRDAVASWDPFRREQLCNLQQQQLKNGPQVMLCKSFIATASEFREKGNVELPGDGARHLCQRRQPR